MPSTLKQDPYAKCPTDIPGLDDITAGGLPRGRTTLVYGPPGCGKTVLALQMLVNGVRHHAEPGIFVAFEENSRRIVSNAATFGWELPALERQGLCFLDAQPSPSLLQTGEFDLGGLLAMLDAKVRETGARRIALDAVDMLLALLDGPASVRREVYRLNEWLLDRELTATLTQKSSRSFGPARQLGFMQFMVDCSIALAHEVVMGVSQRNLRVIKYRGSSFEENSAPFVIGAAGVEIAYTRSRHQRPSRLTDERVSTGVPRLDTMLGGGYYRGASVLITGAPGTAKTTLCGSFTGAACGRGEPTLFVSFDSPEEEVVRNFTSVGISLQGWIDEGLLCLSAPRAINGSAESHVIHIRKLARERGTRCIVVDPISSLSRSGNAELAHSVVERLVDWAKSENMTLLCTSLLDPSAQSPEATPLQISSIADTWIHLSYLVHGGERNRSLTIVKSRGTSHSNQVRELILSDDGIELADVSPATGEVLMGTLRYEKERAQLRERQAAESSQRRRRQQLAAETAQLQARVQALQQEIELKRLEGSYAQSQEQSASEDVAATALAVRGLRGGHDDPRDDHS